MKQLKFALIVLLLSCASDENGKNENVHESTHPVATKPQTDTTVHLQVRTFQNNNSTKGWGYDIYNNGALYIHQPNIPAIAGDHGFSSEADAKKTGEYVAHKIRNNIMPPSITIAEMDSVLSR